VAKTPFFHSQDPFFSGVLRVVIWFRHRKKKKKMNVRQANMPHSPPVPGTVRTLASIGRCLADRNRCAVPVPHGGPWLNQPGQPPEPPEAAKNPEMTRITHKASKTRASPRRVSRFTSHVSPSPSVLSVPSVVKNLCDFASLRLCVKALSHSCVSCLSWSKIRELACIRVHSWFELSWSKIRELASIRVNSWFELIAGVFVAFVCFCAFENRNYCNYLQLTAIYCGYLRPIATISQL